MPSPGAPQDILDRLRSMERQIQQLQKAAPLQNASIGAGGLRFYDGGRATFEDGGGVDVRDGGGVDVHDGGELRVRHPDASGGTESLYVGDLESDGAYAGTGMLVRQPDGVNILEAYTDETGAARYTIRDETGRGVLFTHSAGGLNRPLIPLHPWRADPRVWSGTAAGGFAILAGAMLYRACPQVAATVLYTATLADTTGEIRVMANGTQIGGVVTNADTFVRTAVFGPGVPGTDFDTLIDLTVEARRTAGTGEIKAELKFATSWPG